MMKEEILRLLEQQPDNIDLMLEYVRDLIEEGETQQAKHYLLLALQKEPHNSFVLTEYGKFLYDTGMVGQGIQKFQLAKNYLNKTEGFAPHYLIDALWIREEFQLCVEVIKEVLDRKFTWEEKKFLEKLYDTFVLEIDISLIENTWQLLVILLLAKILGKEDELQVYRKIFSRKFKEIDLDDYI